MTDNKRDQANDHIIGLAFKQSLVIFALLGVLALGAVLVRRMLQNEQVLLDTQVIPPQEIVDDVQPPTVRFTDITRAAGVTFSHSTGAYGDKLLPETMGSGVAFLDFDNDSDQDLLLVNSDDWPDPDTTADGRPTMKLYQNDGHGQFTDVTETTGLAIPFYGMGVAVGDYDNDGQVDIFVTAYGTNHLFHNEGGRFREVGTAAGVDGEADAWSTSASFIDIDNDGDLDLFVANYVRWSKEMDFNVNFQLTGIGRAYGPPNAYQGSNSYLYRNDGDGRFTDISASSGIQVSNPSSGKPMGKALAVSPVDVDGDGLLDLLVANDTVQNFLFYNLGGGKFKERGATLGVAFDRDGNATGAMGTDAAYFRNDDSLGFAIGNFANEMTSLYVAQGELTLFADEAIVEGIGPSSRRALTFGLFFFDYDLDGRLDFLQANGHLEAEINKVQSSQHYRQPPQLFWNGGADCRTSFLAIPEENSGDLAAPLVGRGASYADIDGDGDLDVVISQNGDQPKLLRNDQTLPHHWLRVKLIGTSDNRDAIGSWVELQVGNVVQRRQLMPSRSYLSQVESVLTFGLGEASSVDRLEVVWPNGKRQTVNSVSIDSLLEITQLP